MKLVNKTPLPATLNVSEVGGLPQRLGSLVAKATYRFDHRGPLDLVTADPFPIFAGDVDTELGLLPRDDLPRGDPVFEVILLGVAYAPEGRPIERRRVALSVGAERRELEVIGDRVWETTLLDKRIISRRQPFTRMPLTYEHAFGGSCDVLIDRESPVTVADPINPAGRGFNPEPLAKGLGTGLKVPKGYPVYDPTRRLPNVEDPAALITKWDDAPKPASWATLPMSSALHALRAIDVPKDGDPLDLPKFKPALFHRAHPAWIIAPPPRGIPVVLEGLARDSDRLTFNLPALRVVADWQVGAQHGSVDLAPQLLVLLPEQKRFYLVFRTLFNLFASSGTERGVRLRIGQGWHQPPPPAGL